MVTYYRIDDNGTKRVGEIQMHDLISLTSQTKDRIPYLRDKILDLFVRFYDVFLRIEQGELPAIQGTKEYDCLKDSLVHLDAKLDDIEAYEELLLQDLKNFTTIQINCAREDDKITPAQQALHNNIVQNGVDHITSFLAAFKETGIDIQQKKKEYLSILTFITAEQNKEAAI